LYSFLLFSIHFLFFLPILDTMQLCKYKKKNKDCLKKPDFFEVKAKKCFSTFLFFFLGD